MKKQYFNGRFFNVLKGKLHPDYSYDTFENEEFDFRNKYWKIKKNDVVFDIGASYGSYALTAAVMDAKVYCFEPEPAVFQDLLANIVLNGFNTICYPFNVGMWDEEASIDMKSYAPHWPDRGISCDYNMKTLDQVVADMGITRLDWIKIDVEGAEEQVISGGKLSISKFKPKLIIECHVFLNQRIVNNIKKALLLLGNYKFEEILRDPCVLLYAEHIG
jgi:FkbM family methyltransferase